MKIVINRCFGGFSISKEAAEFMKARGNKVAKAELLETKKTWYGYGISKKYGEYDRTDPDLVAAVETLGSEKASGNMAELHVVEIPDNVKYYIHNYDGRETIHEEHRSW